MFNLRLNIDWLLFNLCIILLVECGAFALNFANFIDSASIETKLALTTNSADNTICRYCICERATQTVICNSGKHLYLRIIKLPGWAETFYAHNLTTMLEMPHFVYHSGLRILRINACGMRYVHPLSLASLPNLETIHLANNYLETIPENFLKRASKLRVLNLASNRFKDLNEIEWSLASSDIILDELILNDNPIELSRQRRLNDDERNQWPLTKQLFMRNTQIKSITADEIIFKVLFKKI